MVVRFVLFIIFIYVLYKIVDKIRQLKTEKSNGYQSSDVGEDLVEDPVCHTYVPISQAHKREIGGKSYFFCSKQCGDKYIMGKQ